MLIDFKRKDGFSETKPQITNERHSNESNFNKSKME